MLAMNEKEFHDIANYIKLNYGINLSHKKNLIEGRLGNYLNEKGYHSYSEYFNQVFADSSKREVTDLLNKLTTNHTFFMRETAHFDFFRSIALPQFERSVTDKDLRIWSAGCSSGQEPYTLAMILNDYFMHQKAYWDTKILATDISVKALESAEKGIYPLDSIMNVPQTWKKAYFKTKDAEFCEVNPVIKSEVIFRVFNLMDERFPFHKKFHTIFCRNVMIYFDEPTKAKLIQKFYERTERGGYLFIGHSESINRDESDYKYVMPAVYRKE